METAQGYKVLHAGFTAVCPVLNMMAVCVNTLAASRIVTIAVS
jgi:hypothetical protein